MTHPSTSLVTDLAGAIDDVRDRHHGYTRLLSNRPNRYGCAATTSPCPLEHNHLSITIDDPGDGVKRSGSKAEQRQSCHRPPSAWDSYHPRRIPQNTACR